MTSYGEPYDPKKVTDWLSKVDNSNNNTVSFPRSDSSTNVRGGSDFNRSSSSLSRKRPEDRSTLYPQDSFSEYPAGSAQSLTTQLDSNPSSRLALARQKPVGDCTSRSIESSSLNSGMKRASGSNPNQHDLESHQVGTSVSGSSTHLDSKQPGGAAQTPGGLGSKYAGSDFKTSSTRVDSGYYSNQNSYIRGANDSGIDVGMSKYSSRISSAAKKSIGTFRSEKKIPQKSEKSKIGTAAGGLYNTMRLAGPHSAAVVGLYAPEKSCR